MKSNITLFALLFLTSVMNAGTLYSRKTGNWTDNNASTGTWSSTGYAGAACGCTPGSSDDVYVGNNFTVTFDVSSNTTISNLTIAGGSTLNITVNFKLTVDNSIAVDGILTGSGTKDVEINNANNAAATLSGTGTINLPSGSNLKVMRNITIPSGTDIEFTGQGQFNLNAKTVTNNGTVSILNPSDFTGAGTFTNNSAASYLLYTTQADFPSITLNCTATGNTVEFGSAAGSYKIDNTTDYYHLIISGAGTKLVAKTNTSINGNLTINSGSTLDQNNKDINVYGDWINNLGGTFTATGTKKVGFLGTAGNQTIYPSAGGETFYDITSNNTASSGIIALNGNITISNQITMTAGNINLNNYTLTLGTSASNTGTLSYSAGTMYNGTLKRWFATSTIANGNAAGLFPVGSSSNYRPLYISAPSTAPTTGGTISVSHASATTVSNVSFTDGASTVSRRHDASWAVLTANGLAGGTYNLRVEGTGFGTIGSVNDLRTILTGSAIGTAGTNAGTTSNPQINRTGLTLANLSNSFFVGSVNGSTTPLPIELLDFTAALTDKTKVELKWSTATEINNDHFTIERSSNGATFMEIATVKGAGNSTSRNDYSTYDEKPVDGTSYYRLKQTDYDGKFEYFQIVAVDYQKQEGGGCVLKVYPNPCMGQCNIDLADCDNKESSEIDVELVDAVGNRVFSKVPYRDEKGSFSFSIDTENNLKPGIYIVRGVSKNETYNQKVIIK